MSHRSLGPRLFLPAAFAIAAIILAGRPLAAEVLEKTADISGTKLDYKVILPNGYDPAKSYPAILAFGGGPQTMAMVEATVNRNWREQAEHRLSRIERKLSRRQTMPLPMEP